MGCKKEFKYKHFKRTAFCGVSSEFEFYYGGDVNEKILCPECSENVQDANNKGDSE